MWLPSGYVCDFCDTRIHGRLKIIRGSNAELHFCGDPCEEALLFHLIRLSGWFPIHDVPKILEGVSVVGEEEDKKKVGETKEEPDDMFKVVSK